MKLKVDAFCWSTFVQIMLLQVSPVEVTSISFSVLQERNKDTSENREKKQAKQTNKNTTRKPKTNTKHRLQHFLGLVFLKSVEKQPKLVTNFA